MKIIHWIGIDDHADKRTIAHYRGDEERPGKEFELVPDEKGYRRLLSYLNHLLYRLWRLRRFTTCSDIRQ